MFETERLIIREYSEEDFSALHEILSDPGTMKFWPQPFSEEQTRGWLSRGITSYKENGFGRWMVIMKSTGRQIGDAGMMLSEVNGNIENDLGYIIHKNFWKMGYGTEAAIACRDFAFNELGLKRLVANMAHENAASIGVAEKIGMKKEKEFYNSRNRGILTYLYSVEKITNQDFCF